MAINQTLRVSGFTFTAMTISQGRNDKKVAQHADSFEENCLRVISFLLKSYIIAHVTAYLYLKSIIH